MLLQVDLKEDIITTLEINIYPVDKHSETLLELYPIKPANQVLPEWYKKQKISKRGSLEYSNLDYSNMKKAKQLYDLLLRRITQSAVKGIMS